MSRRPRLARLADRLGLARRYVPAGARRARPIADQTLAALAAALGWPADSEAEATASLARLGKSPAEGGGAESPRVVAEGRHAEFPVDIGRERGGPVEATLESEDHGHVLSVRVRERGARLRVFLPPLSMGRYRLRITDRSRRLDLANDVISAPDTCVGADEILHGGRAFGLWCNLYSLRRDHDLGNGDLGHLRELIDFAGAEGADFVGVNPLHALDPDGHDPSPYSPLSRLFRNSLYLDMERVSGFNDDEQARRLYHGSIRALGPAARRRIDYESSFAARDRLLARLHACWRQRGEADPQRRTFDRYRKQQGSLLDAFATFLALREHHQGLDWQRWPAPFRHPDSDAVSAFRERHIDRVEYFAWLQFELDRQLEDLAGDAREAGLRIGLYQDLAVGSAPGGFDSWAFPDLFVNTVRLGAPPDDYARDGQDWGLPPLHPLRMRADGYRFWQRLLEANLAHAGALRIDHVLGLFRQWWVPTGHRATDGGYVRFPAEDLLAVAALVSRRSGTLLIGEDLGTVSPEVPARLARHGLLSSRVMLFERERDGRFRPPHRYSKRALVTANTHDHPTLEGWWRGRDLELMARLGRLDHEALEQARGVRSRDRDALLRRLHRDQATDSRGEASRTGRAPVDAIYGWLSGTPSPLLGVAVDDLARETEPVNVPGVSQAEHASWIRRMDATMPALRDGDAPAVLARVRQGRPR